MFHILNHATFKAALFMSAGIVDHETGTRDMRRLGGLLWLMPITGTLAMVAAASMAGLPLLNGFLSKEMCCEAAAHTDVLGFGLAGAARRDPGRRAVGGLLRSASSTPCSSAATATTNQASARPAALDVAAGGGAGGDSWLIGVAPALTVEPVLAIAVPPRSSARRCPTTTWRCGTA